MSYLTWYSRRTMLLVCCLLGRIWLKGKAPCSNHSLSWCHQPVCISRLRNTDTGKDKGVYRMRQSLRVVRW
ncbi:hypothetical protein B0J15DRAFT_488425 [Fusarium solani]|uniref:Secreted protein n=1 Tax=Fusarium solani TaxID=169388 RepID=A0A9P9KKJ8_FUSSL|nr:uncharacterized protein B0J15DRAFT_488425 [Fusarium solani]KAH7266367.1 hypothetical protein B0J15DRAFT_488425 [Fusarium solani]